VLYDRRVALLVTSTRIDYLDAWDHQRAIAARRAVGDLPDVVWLLEHPPVYTYGRHGQRGDLFVDEETLTRLGASCVHTDRGGQMTWHGPGQTTGYVIADVRLHGGVRRFVQALVAAMADASGVPDAGSGADAMGLYVGGRKLGSVGIRVSGGIATHGFALNRDPDPAWFARMSACGAPEVPATSIAAEGGDAGRARVERALAAALTAHLGFDALTPVELGAVTGVPAGSPQ
jgi:lipoyl(octanoyl) transferase